jgi:hypothetical protein
VARNLDRKGTAKTIAGVGGATSSIATKSPWLIVFGMMPLVGVGLVEITRGPYGAAYGLFVLLEILLVAPIVWRLIERKLDFFEPIILLAGLFSYYFVVNPALRLFRGDTVFLGRDFSSLYAMGAAATIVAVSAMWLGYSSQWGIRLGSSLARAFTSRYVSPNRLRQFAWALAALAILSLVIWTRLTGQSIGVFLLPGILSSPHLNEPNLTLNYLFLAIEWFTPAITILVATRGLKRNLPTIGLLGGALIIYSSVAFRYRIVLLLISAVTVLYLRSGRRPRFRSVVAGVLVLLVIVGWVGGSRLYLWTAGESGTTRIELQDTLELASHDTRIFETFLAVVDAVPERIRFAGLEPIAYVFILPIPRSVWPEKPPPLYLDSISKAIGTSDSVLAGAALPNFGEYYVAGGWLGILVGMSLFGIGARALWAFYETDPTNLKVQVVFALSLPFLIQVSIRGYLPQMVQEWCFIILPAVVGSIAATKRRKA